MKCLLRRQYRQAIDPYCDSYGIDLVLIVVSTRDEAYSKYSITPNGTDTPIFLEITIVHYSRNQHVNLELQKQYLESIKANSIENLMGRR